ncbi:hypothetical protein OG539_42790 [Actinacidiphila glaucinigra]|uniref:hypothetical protein n=1 Tax=Actinacidiphila glaucinigra TaxID=235986 RepID=UPI00324E6506
MAGRHRGERQRDTRQPRQHDDRAVRPVPVHRFGPSALRGWYDLRKAKRPFRLRIDRFGITLHDAELAWEQIDAVSLWHVSNTGENIDEYIAPPKSRLTLWTAPGRA